MSRLERIIRFVERDEIFYPLQIVLLPSLVLLAGLVWAV